MSSAKTSQLALPLKSSDTTLHLHLIIYSHTLILFIATKAGEALEAALLQAAEGSNAVSADGSAESAGGGGASKTLTSFVVGVPDLLNPKKPSPSTTPLYTDSQSLDLCTRLCRMLTTKLQRMGDAKQVYVGVCGGTKFWNADEEAEAVKGTIETVIRQIDEDEDEDEEDD